MADVQDATDMLNLSKQAVENGRAAIDAMMQDVLKNASTVINQQAAQILQDIAQDQAFPKSAPTSKPPSCNRCSTKSTSSGSILR